MEKEKKPWLAAPSWTFSGCEARDTSLQLCSCLGRDELVNHVALTRSQGCSFQPASFALRRKHSRKSLTVLKELMRM
jgi:hypothetical protein